MALSSDSESFICCLTILLCVYVIQGLHQYDRGVCLKNESGSLVVHCCFNFYQQNGKCTECENGTVSGDGIFCTKCTGNMYGHQCKFRCSCLVQQRCDLQFGCVNDSELMSTEAEIANEVGLFGTEQGSLILEPAGLKVKYPFYILAGGVICLSILCLTCSRFVFKKRTHSQPTGQQQNSRQPFEMEKMQSQPSSSQRASLPPLQRESQHIYECVE